MQDRQPVAKTAHFSFTVSDLQRSVDFYQQLLGLELVSQMERQGEDISRIVGFESASLKIAFLKLPGPEGPQLELIEYVSPKGSTTPRVNCHTGSAHICFTVTDMEQSYGYMKSMGVRFTSEPVEIMTGVNRGGKAVYFLDPDGISLELIQPANRGG